MKQKEMHETKESCQEIEAKRKSEIKKNSKDRQTETKWCRERRKN